MINKLIIFMFVILCVGCNRSEPTHKIEAVRAKEPNEQAHSNPIAITSGQASISCNYDYETRNDTKIPLITSQLIDSIIQKCVEDNMVHLYYSGEINEAFATLINYVSDSANKAGIQTKILDIVNTPVKWTIQN